MPAPAVSHAASARPAPAPTPDDRVPLDAYDGIAEAVDEAPLSPVPASAPAPAADAAATVDEADLSKMLSDTMGQNIVFKEVDD